MSNEFNITWAEAYRIFSLADRLIEQGGSLNYFDESTYTTLFNQLSSNQKMVIQFKFGDNLTFLNELK